MVRIGDHVSLTAAHGEHLWGTVIGLPSGGRRVTVRLDSNPNLVYDLGASAIDAWPLAA